MKVVFSELKKYLSLEKKSDIDINKIAETLTMLGLEVESVTNYATMLKDFIVAEIISVKPHPNANRLQICEVNIGQEEKLQIVCGAKNARAGIKVVLAKIGTEIPNGKFKIKKTKIRDVISEGMLCSEQELLIANGSGEGIIELPSNAIIGQAFSRFYGYDDAILDINVTPNRGDCLGIYGIARELAAKGIG